MSVTGTKMFPVKEAYVFAESHGLSRESLQIKSIETKN